MLIHVQSVQIYRERTIAWGLIRWISVYILVTSYQQIHTCSHWHHCTYQWLTVHTVM